VTISETKVHHGGLFRCCLLSISKWIEQHKDEPVRRCLVPCAYCLEKVRLHDDGVWRWERATPFPIPPPREPAQDHGEGEG